jgi:hypothetical protein
VRTHRKIGAGASPESGPLSAGHNVFTDAAGKVWSYRGATMFLLFARWLSGEDISPQLGWCQNLGVNTLRVLGMVGWAGQAFGPSTPGFWEQLVPFIDRIASAALRVEFTVFADAQIVMPSQGQQRDHLRRVVDTIGGKWNVLIEVCNEPWQNGCTPSAIWSPTQARPCPMAYGDYTLTATQGSDGVWRGSLPVLSYVTVHTPRDADSWSRKAKDLSEYRDGAGDGSSEAAAAYPGCHLAPVGDEPMGAAEAQHLAGKQRSNIPEDFFWYHANAHLNGAGSTFHSDAGLQAIVPPAGGDQQACAEAAALAWAHIEPEYQTGRYTRGGLSDCPLVWEPQFFPEQTSRIYARVLGDRAVAVAIKPNVGWTPKAAPGWRITSTVGPQASLVHLEHA